MSKVRMNLTVDMSDQPQLFDMLRITAVAQKSTQKQLIVDALTAYFAEKQENHALLDAAARTFTEWHSPEDVVYDAL
jgi:hypothetical protein